MYPPSLLLPILLIFALALSVHMTAPPDDQVARIMVIAMVVIGTAFTIGWAIILWLSSRRTDRKK